jgi:hypothetical protein
MSPRFLNLLSTFGDGCSGPFFCAPAAFPPLEAALSALLSFLPPFEICLFEPTWVANHCNKNEEL